MVFSRNSKPMIKTVYGCDDYVRNEAKNYGHGTYDDAVAV